MKKNLQVQLLNWCYNLKSAKMPAEKRIVLPNLIQVVMAAVYRWKYCGNSGGPKAGSEI
jgi:hypothetical protein